MPKMESLQGERSVFYTCLCKKADKWPTRHWPRLFYRQLQPPPCTVSQSPYKVKGAFSTPVCARKQTNGPPGIDQGFSTGSCNRRHALSARVPTRWKERFLHPFVQESRQMAHPALTKAFLQAAATAAMHCQPERCTHPPPPVPPFLLAQNLSSKRIAPTDNMRPKSDDAIWRHRLLKG